MALSKDNLIGYIRDELNLDMTLDGETELFSTGLLDSVSMVSLITFVEEQTGAHVQPGDVTLENFDTVDAIIAYVQTLS